MIEPTPSTCCPCPATFGTPVVDCLSQSLQHLNFSLLICKDAGFCFTFIMVLWFVKKRNLFIACCASPISFVSRVGIYEEMDFLVNCASSVQSICFPAVVSAAFIVYSVSVEQLGGQRLRAGFTFQYIKFVISWTEHQTRRKFLVAPLFGVDI